MTRSRNRRNRYLGSYRETPCRTIDLPFSSESLKTVLEWGAARESPFTHQELAHWCDLFEREYLDVDADDRLDREVRVASDVDTQWDLFLANTYSLQELQQLDFSRVELPREWFDAWLRELGTG